MPTVPEPAAEQEIAGEAGEGDAAPTPPEPVRIESEVPSYDEVVRSSLYATGRMPSAEGDLLTASDLQAIFESRVRFDDPSHHGGLYSSRPLETREELEARDRRLVARRDPPSSLRVHSPGAEARSVVESLAAQGDMVARDFDGSCLRSGCHQSYTKRPWVHAPVAVGSCQSCHLPADSPEGEHRFVDARSDDRLCSECHQHPRGTKFEHSTGSDADCIKCHDPHGASNKDLLLTFDQGIMCGQCHGSALPTAEATGSEELHEPFAEGKCLSCHEAHRSNHESLTTVAKGELCRDCHTDFIEQFPTFLTLHEPVVKECGSCHVPHGGGPNLIRSMSTDLCLGCHEKVAHSLDQNPMMHTAVKEAKSCLDCHVPHASYSKSLLKGRVGALCISCHDEAIERESGEKIASIKDLFLSTRYWHAPAVEGQCQECHVSHTLDAQKLLFATYPMSLYSDGAEGTYRLCFKCHDDSLLLEDETLSTRFRDGTRNLHRVHLGGKKSRTCATCHEVHAGNVPRLMRATIPFGMSGYVIEVGFQTQQAGGSCGPNCHDAKTYVNASPPGSESLLRYRVESNE